MKFILIKGASKISLQLKMEKTLKIVQYTLVSTISRSVYYQRLPPLKGSAANYW